MKIFLPITKIMSDGNDGVTIYAKARVGNDVRKAVSDWDTWRGSVRNMSKECTIGRLPMLTAVGGELSLQFQCTDLMARNQFLSKTYKGMNVTIEGDRIVAIDAADRPDSDFSGMAIAKRGAIMNLSKTSGDAAPQATPAATITAQELARQLYITGKDKVKDMNPEPRLTFSRSHTRLRLRCGARRDGLSTIR
jgi:hypothetical protein